MLKKLTHIVGKQKIDKRILHKLVYEVSVMLVPQPDKNIRKETKEQYLL